MNLVAWWNSLPYWLTGSIVRAARVAAYGLIPTVAAFVLTNDLNTFEASVRVAISAAILALLDKTQRELRVAAKAESDVSGPSDPDVVDGPTDVATPTDPIIPPDDKDPSGPVPPPAPDDI